MNKQQLAGKIWESANNMRSKIEANEYKDYILGFVFYKFLSEKEEEKLRSDGYDDESLKEVNEDDREVVKYCKDNLGYFIPYEYLFSTWLEKGSDFDVSNVRDGLNSFNRNIDENYSKVFEKIFDTLLGGLSKLGDNSGAQTKAISALLSLIRDIPMNDRQGYDVLGFVYEYLISMFAANAGKKAGEFYTPHEVSLLMSEIVSYHLQGKDSIEIYDPTSGSGSLLINIGKSVQKYMNQRDRIKYYAQELKDNTYNLTRMNLVMRNILPSNIITRNGDTLEDDWPYFDENDRERTYNPLFVDAVVSNPPYSQKWDPSDKDNDPRFAEYGIAPKTKADYAFLLHDLYHLKSDGIMIIVLPHGVLFRGGEEEKIRKNLIENNNIDTIIGLPSNIFFGTGIPTIIMVLKKQKINSNTDVLIIDASKGFIKDGKNNRLRSCDIKKIVDAYIERRTVDKFCKLVTRDEVRQNGYNLNIPRYVDSNEKPESFNIYSLMRGGISESEINDYSVFYKSFPSLKDEVFKKRSDGFYEPATDDVKKSVNQNKDVLAFKDNYKQKFNGFGEELKQELIDNVKIINLAKEETKIAGNIFKRIENIPLVDKYNAYQLLDDVWQGVAVDIEIIQTEGFETCKKVDPVMVVKKKDNKDVEVQDGWQGRIIPFDLIQKTKLKDEKQNVDVKRGRLAEIDSLLDEIIDSMTEDEKDKDYLNDDNSAFKDKELTQEIKSFLKEVTTEEIETLNKYLEISKKKEKLQFISEHNIDWQSIDKSADGTCSKSSIQARITELQMAFEFDSESIEFKLIKARKLLDEQKDLKKEIKELTAELLIKSKKAIENLTDNEVKEHLYLKWVEPIISSLEKVTENLINDFTNKLNKLCEKYKTTANDLDEGIEKCEKELSDLLLDLDAESESDKEGLKDLYAMLCSADMLASSSRQNFSTWAGDRPSPALAETLSHDESDAVSQPCGSDNLKASGVMIVAEEDKGYEK